MLKTLGLDDDLDPVAVVTEVEKAFDIKIADREAPTIFRSANCLILCRRKCLPATQIENARARWPSIELDAP